MHKSQVRATAIFSIILSHVIVFGCLAAVAKSQGQPIGSRASSEQRNVSELQRESVEITGIGETIELARRDAARQAIQRVAGTIIDIKRLVEEKITDDKLTEIFQEKIISYSNAFVEKFDDLSVERRNGLVHLRGRITIRSKALTQRLQEINVPTMTASTIPVDTVSLTQRIETSNAERQSAAELMQSLFQSKSDFYDVKLIGEPIFTERFDAGRSPNHWLKQRIQFTWKADVAREWENIIAAVAEEKFEHRFILRESQSYPAARADSSCPTTTRWSWQELHSNRYPDSIRHPFDRFDTKAHNIRQKRGVLPGRGRQHDQFVCFYGAQANPIAATCYYRQLGGDRGALDTFASRGPKYALQFRGTNGDPLYEIEFGSGYPSLRVGARPFDQMGVYLRDTKSFIDDCGVSNLWPAPFASDDLLILPRSTRMFLLNFYIVVQQEILKRVTSVSILKRW